MIGWDKKNFQKEHNVLKPNLTWQFHVYVITSLLHWFFITSSYNYIYTSVLLGVIQTNYVRAVNLDLILIFQFYVTLH